MRNRVLSIFLLTVFLFSNAYADSITVDSTSDSINITGDSASVKREIPIIIVKPGKTIEDMLSNDSNEIADYFGTVRTDDNGMYSLVAKMPANSEAGNFTVYDEDKSISFWYAGADIRRQAAESFKNADVDNVKKYTEDENVYYGICAEERSDYTDYFLPLNSRIRDMVYDNMDSYLYDTDTSTPENRYKLILEFAEQFEKSAYEVFKSNGLEAIKNIVTSDNVYSVLDKYKDIWSIDMEKLTDDGCQKEIDTDLLNVIKNSSAKTEEDIHKELYSQCCLSRINCLRSANAGKLFGYIDEYSTYLGFDTSDAGIDKLSETQKNNVALKAVKTDYDSSDSLKKAVIEAVNSEYDKRSDGGGSSGGASYGSSSAKNTSGRYVTPENEGSGLIPPVENDDIFDDLDNYEWAKKAVLNLAAKGVVSGTGDGKFEPGRAVTREELLKIVLNSFGVEIRTGDTEFVDVPSAQWYSPYVFTAFDNGIIKGIGDKRFGTGRSITREDAAVIIYNIDSVYSKKLSDELKRVFADEKKISEYAQDAVKVLGGNGIISGYEDGTFKPRSNLTRAEICVIMDRLFDNGGAEG